MSVLLEVVVQSPADALVAEKAGANRLELVCAIETGGLTPTCAVAKAVCSAVKIPVRAMIRPRPGSFVYSEAEMQIMESEIDELAMAGCNGFVFGCLKSDLTVDETQCTRLIKCANGLPCTFHRAFDSVPDPLGSLETLISLGFSTVLTSGQEVKSSDAINLLRELVRLADGRIEVLIGGKVRSYSVRNLIEKTGANAVHQGPFKTEINDDLDKFNQGKKVFSNGIEIEKTRAALDS